MSQVSRRWLAKDVERRMFEVFWKSLADLKKPKEIQRFLYDLLSPTEQIMIAKRLAIAILLQKGYSYEAICDVLKVSPTTVGKISLWLKSFGEGFRMVAQRIIREEGFKAFLLDIEEGLAKFLAAHPASKGRVEAEYRRERFRRKAGVI